MSKLKVVDADGNPQEVSHPGLPSGVTPLTETLAATGYSSEWTPVPGRDINITLSGVWVGTVTVERSFDGGATKHGLTVSGDPWAVYTGNCSEVFWSEPESGVEYYVHFERTSGSVDVRLSQ